MSMHRSPDVVKEAAQYIIKDNNNKDSMKIDPEIFIKTDVTLAEEELFLISKIKRDFIFILYFISF